MTYNSAELYEHLMGTIQQRYPNFNVWRMIFSGAVGSGKSTVAASFPVPEDKHRLVLDMEDSMQFLDAGADGGDIYTPRKQRFQMERITFPNIRDFEAVYHRLEEDKSIGVLVIDNVAIFQDLLIEICTKGASSPHALRELFKSFNCANDLPFDSKIVKWADQKAPEFWTAVKAIPKSIIMTAMKNGIHLIATTEEGNVWKDYGSSNARVIGKRAKVWDVWFRYFDAVVMLQRDINSTAPPRGTINPLQPKSRFQGFNPSWTMDWQGFINEFKEALEREEEAIPEEAKVLVEPLYDEVEV